MGCVSCGQGIWICEAGNPRPVCMEIIEIQRTWEYQGRHRVPAGNVTVWCRANSMVIAQTRPQPLPSPKPAWEVAGEICVPDDADYDVWRKPGVSCEYMIVQVQDTTKNMPCEESRETERPASAQKG